MGKFQFSRLSNMRKYASMRIFSTLEHTEINALGLYMSDINS